MKDSADGKARPKIARRLGEAGCLDQTLNRTLEEGNGTEFAVLGAKCDGAGKDAERVVRRYRRRYSGSSNEF